MKGVLPILRKENGCDYHRIFLPMKYMGYDFEVFDRGPKVRTFDDVEIIYFNRMPLDSIDKVLQHKQKYGFKMVVDMDDWWELNVNHILYNHYKNNGAAKIMETGLRNADAVTCTTARLADKLKPFNSNIHVIPNALPFGEEQFNDDRSKSEFTRFIYAGGSTHEWDVRILINPFKKLINDRLKAQFILAGYNDKNPETKKVWDKMERSFSLNGALKGYFRQRTLPLDEYMNHYTNADVCLVPLESNLFTAYKSNLKVLEAGCKRIPAIVSNTPPYSDEANKEVLMTAGNTREWYDHIKYCAKNPGFVKEKGEQLGEYVRNNYDLRKVNQYREDLFNYLKTK